MTGLQLTTSTRSGPTPSDLAPEGTAFFVGQAERGRVDKAVSVSSLAAFVAEFGVGVTYGYLYDAVRTFFEEGGGIAVIARVVGAAATLGTLTLTDRAGTPVNTLRVDALAPGAHSSRISVAVTVGSSAELYTLSVYFDGVLAEYFPDLTTPAAGVLALAGSRYVRGADLGSGTAPSTSGANNPKASAAAALSAGSDDRASVVTGTYTAALTRFGTGFGTGAVAIPGVPLTSIAVALEAHCRSTQRVFFGASALGASRAQVKADRTTVKNAILAAGGKPEFGGLIGGWATIPDVGASTKAVPPEAYVLGRRNATIARVGVWQPPAGQYGAAEFVVGLSDPLDAAAVQDYDAAGVIPLTFIADPDGSGTQTPWIYGYRSLSDDVANYRLVSSRDLLNLLVYRCGLVLQRYVFRSIDSGGSQLLALVAAELVGILDPIAAANGLYAAPDGSDRGYGVDVGSALNPPDQLAANTIAARIAARPSPTAESILLDIVRAAPLAAVI